MAIEKEKASIGMLQRVFKIGFNRAARIMDQLYEAGVVGPEEGTKPRKVLMSKNKDIEIEITGVTSEGNGVGRHNGVAVFVESVAKGDLAAQDKLYGIQGVVNRCISLTAKFKEEYGKRYDPYPLLPDFYMNVSQAPNFITESPKDIHKCVKNYYDSHTKCLVEIDKMEKLSEEFRARVRALLT